MNLAYSAEIRWILDGDAPTEVKAWFEKDKFCRREPVRLDYYLKFPGDEFVGIKLRTYPEGGQNLEFKPIIRTIENAQLPDGITGRAEEWEKWSIEDQAAKQYVQMLGEKNAWHVVRKVRWLRKYSADNAITKVNPKDRPDNGCNVELTELQFGTIDQIVQIEAGKARPFWTIGFEAFIKDDKNRVQKILEDVLKQEVQTEDHPKELCQYLIIANSTSYPKWLQKLSGTRSL
jgi:hypothetical protein